MGAGGWNHRLRPGGSARSRGGRKCQPALSSHILFPCLVASFVIKSLSREHDSVPHPFPTKVWCNQKKRHWLWPSDRGPLSNNLSIDNTFFYCRILRLGSLKGNQQPYRLSQSQPLYYLFSNTTCLKRSNKSVTCNNIYDLKQF